MIKVTNLVKSFRDGDHETLVLKGINFTAKSGEFIAIMGRSGAGKSTLLYQMSLLDEPTDGDVVVEGRSTREMTQDEEILFRLEKFGYVFQDYALLPDLTALENVKLPLLMQKFTDHEAEARATDVLMRVKLAARLSNLPSQLSGGEQQRASIARAIANQPQILFADEPTANLDRESSATVMELFKELHDSGQTIIMVTHEEEYARFADRIVKIDDGRIISDERVSAPGL